ncbi:PHD-type domain-containing protein [Mycena chlorophos]|uniref:PHD-type domain-containing protein n=1 Tax=Mycena chlorophos TaxID=658473 RepID=A0A8H6TS22_MYCCL|nr:PHD-type domain-containing protein [Mycena chlorophos]
MPKRRRSEAFPEAPPAPTQEELLEREDDLFQSFKDEHVEVFDLQSSLPRKFELVAQLATQDAENSKNLLASILEYIDVRRTNPSHTTRDKLGVIARLSDSCIRTREETVNLTLAAVELVDRSIRLVDQAIAEQERAINADAQPGSLLPVPEPAPVHPRWAKPQRVSLSPELGEALGLTPQPVEQRKKGRGKGRGRKNNYEPEEFSPLPRPDPPVIPNPDPNEKRYCYCNQVSFGEMIACDDPRCDKEWFHLSCTSLEAPPEGRKKWYCDDCKQRKKNRKA